MNTHTALATIGAPPQLGLVKAAALKNRLESAEEEIARLKKEIKQAYFEGFTWAGTRSMAQEHWPNSRACAIAEGKEVPNDPS